MTQDDFDPDRGKTRRQIFWRDNRATIAIWSVPLGIGVGTLAPYVFAYLMKVSHLGRTPLLVLILAFIVMPLAFVLRLVIFNLGDYTPPSEAELEKEKKREAQRRASVPDAGQAPLQNVVGEVKELAGQLAEFSLDNLDPAVYHERSGYVNYEPDIGLKDTNQYWGSEQIFLRDPDAPRDPSGELKKDPWVDLQLASRKDGGFFEDKPVPPKK